MTTTILSLHYMATGELHERISAVGKQKANKLLSKPKAKTKTDKPYPLKIADPSDFVFEHEEDPEFLSNLNPNGTYIAYSVTPYPEYLQEEKAAFEEVFVNISLQTINHQYWRKFLVIRGSTMLSISAPATSKDRYINFIKDLVKLIYKEIYEKRANTDNIDLSKIESLHEAEQEDKGLLSYDFFNPSTLSIVTSLYEIFDKITDDEIENCVFLASHSFIHPYNWFLSPAALALAYFHSQLLFLKKPYKEDLYYTKQNLPSITYISLTGIYSEMDIDVLNAFSENIQTIIVYDETTGGPSFSQKGEYSATEDLRIKKRNFQEISNKLLLVPFHNSKTKKQGLKDFSPNDLLWIVENVILAAIEKFRPSYIVLNCSLIFDESNNTPFLMDQESMTHIINVLKQVCDNKVVVFPFKLANQKNPQNAELFNSVINYAPKNQQDRLRNVVQKYGVPYNNLHVRDIFMSIFEALAGLKEAPNNWERLDLIKRYRTNTIMGEVRYRIGKQYKDHPYYKNLYSNVLGVLSRIAKNETANIEGFSSQSEKKLINKIALYYPPDNDIKILKLKLQTEGKEIILNQNSQYFVDYINPEEVKVYIFNANSCEINSNLSLRTYGPRSNFELSMELEDTVRQYSIDDHESINVEDLRIEPLKDCGICKCGDFVFQVYGTDIRTNQDSTKIHYFNFKTSMHCQINVPEGILPRHGVTTCAFKKDDLYHLYVFGGRARTGSKYNGTEWGTLDIIDIVEIYTTNDPLSGSWTYQILPKEKDRFSTEKERVPFIPYYGSFAFYSENKNKIFLMGGKLFEKGVSEWTFPVLEYDIEAKRFDSLKIILNDAKNNPARSQIKNNEYKRPVLPTAIADKNKNLFYNSANDTFKFVIPRPDDLFVTLYSYDAAAQNSDYLDIEIDNEENITRIAPPSLNKDINPRSTAEKKVVYFDSRVATNFKYQLGNYTTQLAEFYLIEWRVCQKEEVDSDKWKAKLTELIEKNKDYVVRLTEKMKEMDLEPEDNEKIEWQITEAKRRETGFRKVLSFAEANQGFKEVITGNDSRIELLRTNLVDRFSSSQNIEKRFMTYNKYFETFLCHELEDVSGKGEQDIFQVYEEAKEKKILEKLDIPTKRRVIDLLSSIIKAFQEPKPVNPDYSFQSASTTGSTLDTTPSKLSSFYGNPKQGLEESFAVENAISFSQMLEYFESRPLLYKLSPSVFLKDYVEKSQKQLETYQTLKANIEDFQSVISSGSSISTTASESDIPDKIDQELKEILTIVFTAAERIIAKLAKHTKKSLKYGSLIPPPSLIHFELFLILLMRMRKDIEDPDTKVGKILNETMLEQTRLKEKAEHKKEPETSKPSVLTREEVKKETFTEERATPQGKKQSSLPPVQTLPRPVGVDREIQVEERELSPLLEEDLQDTPDKEGKDVKIYQENLTTSNTYKLIFNPGRSELLIILQKDGQTSIRRLRFKIYLKGQNGKKGRLEDISFESSPYSIAIYENNVVAYIDQNLKVRHSDVYNKYKACVIYADLKAGIESVSKESEVEDLVFRKLFLVGQDDHIHSRCLVVTEESVFLFGGRSFKFKGKASIRQHGEVSLYFTKKMESVEQNSSEFKDSEIDNLNEKGEVAAIYTGEVIFVTKRFEPSIIEIFKKDGTTDEDESIEVPEAGTLKGYTVRMNLVNFRQKEEILFSCFCKEKDIKFMLLDVKEKEFETEPISLTAAAGQEKINLLYTGFEEIEAPISKSGAQELFFYTYRGDSPEVFKCEIKVGK